MVETIGGNTMELERLITKQKMLLILKVEDSIQRYHIFVGNVTKFIQESSENSNVAGTCLKAGEFAVLFTSEENRQKYYEQLVKEYEVEEVENL